MTRYYAIANQKGGVGKTTTAVNLAASLGALGRRVLLADLDPQGNATTASGIDKRVVGATVAEVLAGRIGARDAITPTPHGTYDLLPSNESLSDIEVTLLGQPDREHRLRDALRALDGYDFVLIDCPPTLNILTVNALAAAPAVLIPAQCEFFALEGLSSLQRTIEQLRQSAVPGLHVAGVLRTMFDPRNNLARDVSAQLQEHFGDALFETVVPRNVTLAEAPSHGLPVVHYDKRSRGAQAYLMLAGELLRRNAAPAD